MNYQLIAAPAVEPVTLVAMKDWLKIDDPQSDSLIMALITSARLSIEAITGLMLITQTWRVILNAWPSGGELAFSHGPLQSLSACRIYDVTNTPQPVSVTQFEIDRSRTPRVMLNSPLPPLGRSLSGVELDCIFGYGNDPSSVPEPLKLAIKMLVAFWHEHRGDDMVSDARPWPDALSTLIQPFLLRRL